MHICATAPFTQPCTRRHTCKPIPTFTCTPDPLLASSHECASLKSCSSTRVQPSLHTHTHANVCTAIHPPLCTPMRTTKRASPRLCRVVHTHAGAPPLLCTPVHTTSRVQPHPFTHPRPHTHVQRDSCTRVHTQMSGPIPTAQSLCTPMGTRTRVRCQSPLHTHIDAQEINPPTFAHSHTEPNPGAHARLCNSPLYTTMHTQAPVQNPPNVHLHT